MDEWATVEQIAAARERFESALPGWTRPLAHGVVVDGDVLVWNKDDHPLPAVVLATVLGHDGSTAAVEVTPSQLEEAISMLAPAEACKEFDHPNLLAWRAARGRAVTAVFIGRRSPAEVR